MSQPEFWELSDAEIWGLVDGDWLMRQFARSEKKEAHDRRAAVAPRRPGLTPEQQRELFGAFLRSLFQACLGVQLEWECLRPDHRAIESYWGAEVQRARDAAITMDELHAAVALMTAPSFVDFPAEPRPILAPPTWTALPAPRALSRARLRDWHARLPCRPYRGPATRRC